jgi:hypothetical protein
MTAMWPSSPAPHLTLSPQRREVTGAAAHPQLPDLSIRLLLHHCGSPRCPAAAWSRAGPGSYRPSAGSAFSAAARRVAGRRGGGLRRDRLAAGEELGAEDHDDREDASGEDLATLLLDANNSSVVLA